MATDTPSGEDLYALAQRLASGQPLERSSALPAQTPSRPAGIEVRPSAAVLTKHHAFLVDCKAGRVTVANSVANPFHLQADMAEALSAILEYVDGEP